MKSPHQDLNLILVELINAERMLARYREDHQTFLASIAGGPYYAPAIIARAQGNLRDIIDGLALTRRHYPRPDPPPGM